MKLWMLTQNDITGYDTYDSCIVAANNDDEARNIHPSGEVTDNFNPWKHSRYTWASSPDNVTVTCIGTAIKGTKAGVILASFNAG